MKKVMAIIFLIPVLVLIGTGEAPTRGSFTLADLISFESGAVDIPVEIVYAVILTESSGNPHAKSEADCRGLMQISKEVWNIFMKGKSWDLAYHPEENVRCGIRYLGDLYKMYASWEKVLRHYHSGDPNSNRAVTNRYVKKVLKRAGMMERTWSEMALPSSLPHFDLKAYDDSRDLAANNSINKFKKRDSMGKRVFFSVVVAGMLLLGIAGVCLAGVEPSPFEPAI